MVAVTLPMRWHISWSIRPEKQRQSAVPPAARLQLAGCPTAPSLFDSDSCSSVSFDLFLACWDVFGVNGAYAGADAVFLMDYSSASSAQ